MAQPEPPHYPVTECDSCKAPIIWARMPSGDRHPINAEPVNPNHIAADIRLHRSGDGKVRATRVTNQAQLFGQWAYRSHFDTCPHAAKWRTARRPRRG